MRIRKAPFALRVVDRANGKAAVVYRRAVDGERRDRLQRIAAISPLAFVAGGPLLRAAVRGSGAQAVRLDPGPYHALDADWGARVACFALVVAGLRNTDRIQKAGENLRRADGPEAAWWLGHLTNSHADRALRALRILSEAVE